MTDESTTTPTQEQATNSDQSTERDASTKQSLTDLYHQYYPTEAQPANPAPIQQVQQNAAPNYNSSYEQQYPSYDQTATADPTEARLNQLNKMVAELKAELGQERQSNAQQRQQMALETQRIDMEKAIDTLAAKVDVPNKKLIKYVVADYWENNPVFQKIWEKRNENRKMFSDALNQLVPHIQRALEVKADPDLVQKQMAMDQFNRTIGSEPAPPQTEGERFSRMSDDEFNAEWQRIAGRIQ